MKGNDFDPNPWSWAAFRGALLFFLLLLAVIIIPQLFGGGA